jgi:regulator of sirC expression with transglutaminase-like and TPR domain
MQMTFNDGEVKAMISLLDDTDQEVYRHIETKLIKLGREVIPMLEDAWSNAFDAVMQQRIENIVHKIQFESLLEDLKLWIHTGDHDLLAGTILVARYQYPDLDEEKIYSLIAQIRKEIWLELNESLTSLEIVNIINHVLFNRYGFGGNTANYHAPQNSYINCVLESKKGNPLALSILYQVISQQLNLPIYGVNLPEHFILSYLDDTGNNTGKVLFYINAFSKGSVFGHQDIDQFIKRLNLEPKESYYNPCTNKEMLQRMVRNIIYSYQKLGDTTKVEELTEMIKLFGTDFTNS